MNKDNRAVDLLVNKILSAVNTRIAKLGYDKTFQSTVWGINDNGTYQISYMGQLYNVPNALGTQLPLGQSVWVKIPSGIFRKIHICGICTKKK
ncbi:MAG: hypothetical protein ACI4EQ_10835 [Lachnospiraceae bacterium]